MTDFDLKRDRQADRRTGCHYAAFPVWCLPLQEDLAI